MRISQGDLQYYRSVLDDIATQATDYVRDAIEQLGDGQGVTAMREAAIEALQESVSIHGEMSLSLAAQLFDEVCSMEGIGPFTFEMVDDIIDFAMLEEKVRYYARSLVEDEGNAKFLNDCGQLADFYARRTNYESMVRNCYRNHVRYARVPTSGNPCDFCLMLASRGFVYYDQVRAEEGRHDHCSCVAVPGNGADATSPTQIEGYDPLELYRTWQDRLKNTAMSRAKANDTSYQIERMKIMDSYKESARRAHKVHKYRYRR
jgi:hypothetical protein